MIEPSLHDGVPRGMIFGAERARPLAGRLMALCADSRKIPGAGPAGTNDAPHDEGKVEHPQPTIMVVEDDPDVAEVAAAVLENMGYRVSIYAEARSALALLQQGAEVDLVFSDIVMPGSMDGIDLAEAISKQFPDLPVLLATGFSNAALAPRALRFPVLSKPYSVQELTRRIGQLLPRKS